MTRFLKSLFFEQILTAAAMGVLLSGGFALLSFRSAGIFASGTELWDAGIALDALLPFRPRWIWVYLTYFPICFLPLCVREVRGKREIFLRTVLGFASQFLLAFLIFYAFPARMIRPEFVPDSLSGSAVAWLYGIDPGYNIWPSLHVANTAFLACLAGRFWGRLPGLAVWSACALISISALLVKQHYLLDLPAGVLLGVACFKLAFERWSLRAARAQAPQPWPPPQQEA